MDGDVTEQRAAEWLVRMDAGASAVEQQELQSFLDVSPRHRAAYVRLSVAWNRADRLRRLIPPDGEVDADLLSPTARVEVPLQTQRPRWFRFVCHVFGRVRRRRSRRPS